MQEHRGEYPSSWLALESIAPRIGCVPQTLLTWVKRQEIEPGAREGATTFKAQRARELERENKNLRRVNEMASAFFAQRSSTEEPRSDLADLPIWVSTTCGSAQPRSAPS